MINNVKDQWPCIEKQGLDIFSITADQRILLGEDLFLSTHFPMKMNRFRTNAAVDIVSENELSEKLLEVDRGMIGNRVFVLYGAAGSGKSELIRWLQLDISKKDPSRSKAMIRIPRTELDILSITESFQHHLSQSFFSEATHLKWQEARRKPRTIAKILLLTALERMIDSDEQVNALYYRLLEWVQPRISRVLGLEEENNFSQGMPLEVITQEDLDQLKKETALSISLDYEQFRHHLLLAFKEHLLEGIHLPNVLALISNDFFRNGIRPILLIDDLVQSINLFATDILDYLITLESGNWDVVIGLTPDAMSESKRGKELLDRITYLDTIDDRVEKLWLSDMYGHDSYFLTLENCADFLQPYLRAFRERNGWECSSCSYMRRCQDIEFMSSEKWKILSPFNQVSIQRLFKTLPEGKGKARQFLKKVSGVLGALEKGDDIISSFEDNFQPDFAAEAENSHLSRLLEIYFPSIEEDQSVEIPTAFLKAFGYSNGSNQVLLRSLKISNPPNLLGNYVPNVPSLPENDASRVAIKAWLNGERVNKQSLQQLRRGIARWLRAIYPIDGFHAEYVAKPNNVLKWNKVYLSVHPPIIFEDVDEEPGILITRDIGLTAFLLGDFANAIGNTAIKITNNLAADERAIKIAWDAEIYHKQLERNLEEQLRLSVPELALLLYVFSLSIKGGAEYYVPFTSDFYKTIKNQDQENYHWLGKQRSKLFRLSENLFDDYFKLRENTYDGNKIKHYLKNMTIYDCWERILKFNIQDIHQDYWLGDHPLAAQLSNAQNLISKIKLYEKELGQLSIVAQSIIEMLTTQPGFSVPLDGVATNAWEEIRTVRPDLFSSLRVILTNDGESL